MHEGGYVRLPTQMPTCIHADACKDCENQIPRGRSWVIGQVHIWHPQHLQHL